MPTGQLLAVRHASHTPGSATLGTRSGRAASSGRPRAACFIPRLALLLVLLVQTPTAGCAKNPNDTRARADAAFNEGRYEEARRLYSQLIADDTTGVSAVYFARTFEARGDYLDGIEQVRARLAEIPGDAGLLRALGRLQTAVGLHEEAIESFARAIDARPPCGACQVDLADLLVETGSVREAISRYADAYLLFERGRFRSASDLSAAARAAAALGRYRDANRAFRTAHQLDPRDVENLFEWAELFREKHSEADARRTYGEALQVNPRHVPTIVGMARMVHDFERQEALIREALSINPHHAEALGLLASLQLLDGQYNEALSNADRALEINPRDIHALAQRASVLYLRGDSTAFREVESTALETNPLASRFYLTIAENVTRRYRYPEAVRFAEMAVRTNPRDAAARAEMGMALLRLGRREEARHHLEAAYEGDPYNLFASNTLTLLDEYGAFVEIESPNFRLLIHENEREVLGSLVLDHAEEAFSALRERYPYEPRDKLVVEAYNDADDFAVRIAGIPHRGLLGVCFGDVVAINTPVAQTGQPYNWARTLWHEIAHTMAIGLSDYRVPRWFTEGLSVYEEQLARASWGRDMELALLSAHEKDRLLPLGIIDQGFTRPRFPGQVILSYYHAADVIRLVVEDFGTAAIPAMLRAFAAGSGTDDAVEEVLGLPLTELDARHRADLERRGARLAGVIAEMPDVLANEDARIDAAAAEAAEGTFFRQLRTGMQQLERRDHVAAEQSFRSALSIYPDYTGPRNAYEYLARIYRETNQPDALTEILKAYLDRTDQAPEAARELAALHQVRGNRKEALHYLERSLEVAPYDPEVRALVADVHEELEQFDRAVLHRRAVVALDPPDRAGAHYRLARALHAGGWASEARRAVVRSLEVAPGFRDAQSLLLEIVDRSSL